MLRIEARDRVLVVGQTGTGKSHFAKQLVGELMAEGRRILVLDVKDEYSVKGRVRVESDLGPLPHRWTAAQVAAQPEVLEHPALLLAVVPEEPTRARTAFQQWARAFVLLAELLRDYKLPVVFVLEEVQSWAKHQQELVEAVAVLWRDYGASVVFVSQRAVGIPISARAQLSQIVSFSQQEPADIEALRDRTALNDPEFADRVSRLSGQQFLTWRAGASNGEGKERRAAEQAQPDQDGGRGGGDVVRPGEGEPGERPDVPDVQVREGGGAEDLAPPPPKKLPRGGRRSAARSLPNP